MGSGVSYQEREYPSLFVTYVVIKARLSDGASSLGEFEVRDYSICPFLDDF